MCNISKLFFVLFIFQLCSCKQQKQGEKLVATQEKHVASNLSYKDIIGKTFFVLNEEDGDLIYDSYGVSDMTEYISFFENRIEHFMPMDVYSFLIESQESINNETLEVKTTNNENVEYKKLYRLKYDEKKHCLFSFENNTKTVYIDKEFLNTVKHKQYSKSLSPEEKIKAHLVFLSSEIDTGTKKINIELPFVKEHENGVGDTIWGKDKISSNLIVKMIKGQKGNLFSINGEGKCGACPNFSAFYSIDGDLLCYAYSIRVSVYEGKTLLKKGDFEKVMSDYGITNKDLNIQYNHPDTPTYLIKDWY